MTLPEELKEYIKFAKLAIQQNPKCDLIPYHRLQIYSQIGPLTNKHSRCIRTYLGIISIQKVSYLWLEEYPADVTIKQLLSTAVGVLNEEISQKDAELSLEHEWLWLEKNGENNNQISERAYWIRAATFETLQISMGHDTWNGVIIEKSNEDNDLDSWSSDPAHYVSSAFAGGG